MEMTSPGSRASPGSWSHLPCRYTCSACFGTVSERSSRRVAQPLPDDGALKHHQHAQREQRVVPAGSANCSIPSYLHVHFMLMQSSPSEIETWAAVMPQIHHAAAIS